VKQIIDKSILTPLNKGGRGDLPILPLHFISWGSMGDLLRLLLLCLLLTILPLRLWAQPEEYNHPELTWVVYNTDHFQIYYYPGSERTARELARIAEDIYEPITSLYNWHPDSRTRLIVRDHDDYSNGGAYYYDNKIVIWATALNFDLRGTHNWLRNVCTHEFTHIIQLGASRKGPRWIPGVYLQWISYENEKRPDVLYGYPNILASYPLPGTIIPPWFAEGCAQTQRPGLGYDFFDSNRDMILRTRVLENKLLTYTEMGFFDKTSLDAETVYNQGFSLVHYIVERWGAQALQDISADMRQAQAWSFDYALKKRLGLDGQQLYRQWVEDLKKNYLGRTATINANLAGGSIISEKGFGNLHPIWAPDGKSVAYTSNPGGDYFFLSSLYLYDLEKKTSEQLTGGVHSQLSFSPEGRYLFFNKQFGPGKHGSHFDDLAAWDIKAKKVIRLTKERRAAQVDVSPDGNHVCYVVSADGTENLWVAELSADWQKSGKGSHLVNEKALTQYINGEQVYGPRWSPDGKSIAFAWSLDRGRDLRLVDVASGEIKPIIATTADERDPVWGKDGYLYYASDQTGIFNLYRMNLADATTQPVSNVLGGTFMPALSVDGHLAFADYHADGFKLALLDTVRVVDPALMGYVASYPDSLPVANYSRDPALAIEGKIYKPSFDKTFILPRLTLDYGTFKPGFYFYFQDILEQMSAFGGFAMNQKKDYDLFALVDYKKLAPTIFAEFYNVSRHTAQSFEDPTKIIGEIGTGPNAQPIFDSYSIAYSFNLMELDLGVRMKVRDEINLRLAGILSRYRTNTTLSDGTVFGYTYLKGRTIELTTTADYRAPGRDQDIAPSGGFYIQGKVARENNDFINGFTIDASRGTIEEAYTPYHYDRFQVLTDYYLSSPLKKSHALTLTADLGLLDMKVDPFFHLYAGGLDGMRGYSYYSLGGTRKAILRGTYNLPLWRNAAKRLSFITLDKVYLQGYADVGNAWVGNLSGSDLAKDFKKDAGLGLKVQMFSFATFPTALSADAAYGFDRFSITDQNGIHTYGQEWRFYMTLLFNFNLRQSLGMEARHLF
jgi:hypothetical protein